jgi:large subunit ribosomal protein L29
MKATEIRGRSTTDLHEEAGALEREIATLRFRAGSEKGGDPSRIGALRVDLARIRTVLRERELDVRGQGADATGGRARKARS